VYRESGGDWFEGDVIDIVRGPGKKKYKVRFLGESEIFEVFENFILLKSDSFPKPLSTVGVGHEDSGFSVGEACEVHVPTKNIWIPAKIVEVHASADSKQVAYYQIESQGKLLSVRPAHLRRIVTEVKESVPTGWYEGQSVMLKPPGHTAWVRGKITEVLLEQSPTKYRVEFKKRAKTEILLMDCVVDERSLKRTRDSISEMKSPRARSSQALSGRPISPTGNGGGGDYLEQEGSDDESLGISTKARFPITDYKPRKGSVKSASGKAPPVEPLPAVEPKTGPPPAKPLPESAASKPVLDAALPPKPTLAPKPSSADPSEEAEVPKKLIDDVGGVYKPKIISLI